MSFIPTALPIFVENVAALATSRARTADGGVINTAGYYSGGDNGGQGFVYRRSGRSSVTIDDGFFIVGPGVDDYFEAIEKDSVDLMRFGCRGDGSDDTARFLVAADTAKRFVVPLRIPGDTFNLSSLAASINIDDDFAIVGVSAQSKLIGPSISMSLFSISANAAATVLCEQVSFSTFHNVFLFQHMTTEDPHEIIIRGNRCDNFGGGICNPVGGGKINATSIQVTGNVLTNMGLNLSSVRPWAIDIDIMTCPKTTISDNQIENVGSDANTDQVVAIWVNATGAADKSQSVIVSNNIIRNVRSATSDGTDQVGGIFVLQAHAVVTNNVIDTVWAPNHSSSPEAIYIKASHSTISGNVIIDVVGSEGVINMKGELTGSSSSESSVVSNNVISFRTLPVSGYSTGINMAAPNINCIGNTVEGVTRGCVCIFDGVIIKDNVFRYCGTSGIECVAVAADFNLTIKNNVFTNIGTPTTRSFAVDISTDVFTDVGHGLTDGHLVRFTGSDLPAPIVAGKFYYVSSVTTDTFKVSLLPGGVAVDITDIGTGTQVYDGPSTAYGIVFSSTEGRDINLLEITGNTFQDFVTHTSVGAFVVHAADEGIRSLICNRNVFNDVTTGLAVQAVATETVRYLEFSCNSLVGATTPFSSTAQLIKQAKLLNTTNGSLWSGNDSPNPYDPLTVEGCVSWWDTTDRTSCIRFTGTGELATAGKTIARILDKSASENHLNVRSFGPILHDPVTSDLPSQSAYFYGGASLKCTLPASCGANCTMFLVQKIPSDTKYIWWFQDPFYSSADIRNTWSAEDGSVDASGPGTLIGTPTFRVNGATADFSTRQKVFDATKQSAVLITAEGLDFSGWDFVADRFHLGGFLTGVRYVDGYFIECLLFDRALTVSERAATEAYLANAHEIILES